MGKCVSKFNRSLYKFIMPFFVMLCFSLGSSFAWFSNSQSIEENNNGVSVTGSIQAKYFNGTGTADDPYLISTPIQLYYFSWLQNLGYYNVPNEDGTAINQVYVKLENDVDMTGYNLPPIGTTQYPFVGNFNGAGYTISNLTIQSSVDDMENVPTAVYVEENEYQKYAQIVGFFGCVGSVNSAGTVYSGGTAYTYDTSINEAYNFTLDSLSVTVQQTLNDKLLVGLVAGYVNGTVSQAYVKDSSIDITASKSALGSINSLSLTDKLSDYSVVGYCRSPYRKTIDIVSTYYRTPSNLEEEEFFYEADGEENQWGGSLSMYDMYNTIYNALSSASSNSCNYTGTTVYYRNAAASDGSYKLCYIGNSSPGNYLYLGGHDPRTYYKPTSTKLTSTSGVSGFGLCFTSTSTGGGWNQNQNQTRYIRCYNGSLSSSTSTSNYTYFGWSFDSNNYVYSYYNNKQYYLQVNGTSLSITTSKSSASVFFLEYINNYVRLATNIYGSTYYLISSGNSSFSFSTNSAASSIVYLTEASPFTLPMNPTYFPLKYETTSSSSSTYSSVSNYNTGYMVSGSNTTIDNSSSGASSDTRVSKYNMAFLKGSFGNSSLTTSNQKTYTSGSDYLDVITRTVDTNGWVIIKDDYNSSVTSNSVIEGYTNGSSVSTTRLTPTQDNDSLTLQKYVKSRSNLEKTLRNQSYVYGLHFLDGTIGGANYDRYAYATKAVLYTDGETRTYSNYPLPTDSIDFNLAEDGIVNFFIGAYFNSNQQETFFRLYKILRDSNQNITDIYEISKVYSKEKNGLASYYYQYDGGTTGYPEYSISSANISNTDTLEFNMDYVRYPLDNDVPTDGTGICPNTVFYFEIPLGKGEYAIGPDSTLDGAYIIYLDIGANAQKILRNTTIQVYEDIQVRYDYPIGVALIGTTAAIDLESISIGLTSSYSGSITFTRDSNGNVTIDSSNTNYVMGFQGNDGYINSQINNYIVVSSSQGNTINTTNVYYEHTKTRVITYYDYNNVSNALYVTTIIIADTTINNGTTVRTFSYSTTTTQYDDNGDVTSTIANDELPAWITDIENPSNDENALVYYNSSTPNNDSPADPNTNAIILKYVNPSIYDTSTGEPTLMNVEATFIYDYENSTVYITIDPTQFEDSANAVSEIYVQYEVQANTSGLNFVINESTTLSGSSAGSSGRVTISVPSASA